MRGIPPFLGGLGPLMEATAGSSEVAVGLIDGPVDAGHPDLEAFGSAADAPLACSRPEGDACRHGTFLAGILGAERGSPAPGICPGCRFLIRPVFSGDGEAVTGPREVAAALLEVIEEGARVVNLSLELIRARRDLRPLGDAVEVAAKAGVILVAAAGNRAALGAASIYRHPWILPVVACDARAVPLPNANLGPSIGRTGLMAQGSGITSAVPGGGHGHLEGSSVAAPFVTGAIALMLSLYPNAPRQLVRRAILRPGVHRRTLTPPLLDAAESLGVLARSLGPPRPTA
ncbi:MAG: S8 family serine peptidase [Acidobacteriota bacterium]